MTNGVRIALVLLVFAATGCAEVEEAYFRTGEDAHRDTAAQRGWVPKWLPAQAAHVYLQWNLDTNETWIAFELDALERPALKDQLSRLSDRTVESLKIPRPRTGWWFESLAQQQPKNRLSLQAIVFRGTGSAVPRETIVAFQLDGPRVFAWTNPQ